MVEEGNLDLYVHFLRKKLREIASDVRLTTVRGIGYRLVAADLPSGKEGILC
jgi:DNA-binding response OmpR family regulator